MRDQLRALVTLSRIDAQAREIDGQLQKIPAELAAKKADVTRLAGLLAKERDAVEQARALKKSHEEEISRYVDQLGKSKAKAAKARNAREADAVEREVETARRSLKEREAERDRLTAAIDSQQAALAGHEGELASLEALFVDDDNKAKARIAELEVERVKVLQGREVYSAKIEKATLRRYEQLREKRAPGVVELDKSGICLGCRLAIPPQLYNEFQRNDAPEVPQCPHCRRILYTPALIEEPTAV